MAEEEDKLESLTDAVEHAGRMADAQNSIDQYREAERQRNIAENARRKEAESEKEGGNQEGSGAEKTGGASDKAVGDAAMNAAKRVPQTAAAAKGIEAAENVPGVGPAVEEAKKQLGKQLKKKILLAIAPYIPVIALVGGIVLVVVIIAMVIIGYIYKGSAGRTAPQYPDPNNAAHMQIKNQTLASTGKNPDAYNALAAADSEILIGTTQILTSAMSKSYDPAIVKIAGDLDNASAGLATANPQVGGKAFFDQAEQLKQFLALAQLCQNAFSTLLPADQAKCPDYTKYLQFTKQINDLLSAIEKIQDIEQAATESRLVINGKDEYYIRTNQVDLRILKALNYLITPVELGGAGFRKIKVQRIKSSYDSENNKFAREWYEESADVSKEDTLISPHFYGEAMDISAIDMVDRRLVKSRVIKKMSKIVPQPPNDILVVLQSSKAGQSASGGSTSSDGQSFGTIFENGSMQTLLSTLGESLGYDFSGINVKSGSTPAIAQSMGLIILGQELGIKIDPNDDNSALASLVDNFGAASLADCLGLPKAGLKGETVDQVQTNIGKEIAAMRLKIASSSFSDTTSPFVSVGKRKIEKSFGLRNGSLDYFNPGNRDFTSFVGEVLIEQELNLPGGSFASNDLEEIKKAVGVEKFNRAFANPDQVDNLLNLNNQKTINTQGYRNYTAELISGNGTLSPADYRRYVGDSLMTANFSNFNQNVSVGTISTTKGLFSSSGFTQSGTDSFSDDVWDLPKDSLQRLVIGGDHSTFFDIGKDEIAKRITDNENERELIRKWLDPKMYADRELKDLGYKRSALTGEITIRPKDQIQNPDSETARILGFEWVQLEKKLKLPIFSGSVDQAERADNLSRKASIEDQLALLGYTIKVNEADTSQFVLTTNYTDWIFIDEEYYNKSLGLPVHALSNIFRTGNSDGIFNSIGVTETDNLQIKGNNTSIAARTQSINGQYQDALNKLSDLQTQLMTARIAGDQNQMNQLQNQVDSQQTLVDIFESQQRMDQASNAQGTSSTGRKKTSNNAMKCSNENVMDILTNLHDAKNKTVASSLENALDLPPGALTDIINGKKEAGMTAHELGQKHIEETFGMPAGSFSGGDLTQLLSKFGGYKNFFRYFMANSGRDSDFFVNSLPIISVNQNFWKGMLKTNDQLLSIDESMSFDLLKENITPDQYIEFVGRAYLKVRSSDSFGKSLGIDVGGYTLNTQDMIEFLNGNYAAVAFKVGLKNMDDGLQLPYGTMKALVDNPGFSCMVTDPATGLKQNCIENMLAANGKEKLAHFMGLYGNATISGNMAQNVGQSLFENALNELYPNIYIPNGWFVGDKIEDMAAKAALINEPVNCKDKKNAICIREIEADAKKIVAKLGLDSNTYKLTDLKNISYLENSAPGNAIRAIDDKLHLNTSQRYTEKMLKGTISISDYKEAIQKANARYQTEDWVVQAMPGDFGEYLRKVSPAKLKKFYAMYQDPAKRKMAESLIGFKKNQIEEDINQGESELLGELIIEERLGPDPTGWFDEIQGVFKGPTGTYTLPKTSGVSGIVKNMAILLNPTILPPFLLNQPSKLSETEKVFLAKFGISGDYTINKIKKIDITSDTKTNDSAYNALLAIDRLFGLSSETTINLFQGNMAVDDYKNKVESAYLKSATIDFAFEELVPQNIKDKMNQHGITLDDIRQGVQNPDSAYSLAMMTFLKPDDLNAVLGLFGDQLPIKGEFTANYAQQIVEETLGLIKGSFSPDNTIGQVMQINGAKKFAASWRIIPLNTEVTESFLNDQVFRSETSYWNNNLNVARSSSIDSVLKVGSVSFEFGGQTISRGLTQALLMGSLSVADYIEEVRKNQFEKIDESKYIDFLAYDPNGSSKPGIATYLASAKLLQGLLKNPDNFKDPNQQVNILNILKATAHIDLDDKMGFSPGTFENLISHPGDARSILFAQGMRYEADRIFADDESQKNNLLVLFQYYLPGFNPQYITQVNPGNPNDPNNYCTPAVQKIGSQDELTKQEQQDFLANHRTTCANFIINNKIIEYIAQVTAISTEAGENVPGIVIPYEDVQLLRQGDMKAIQSLGFAYLANSVRAEQDKDGNKLKLLPDEFVLSYQDIRNATWGTSDLRERTTRNVAGEWDKTFTEANNGHMPRNPEEWKAYYTGYDRAVADAQDQAVPNARKDLQYRYYDAQSRSLARANDMPPVPFGFFKTMFEGTQPERQDAMLRYSISYALLKEGNNLDKFFVGDVGQVAKDFVLKNLVDYSSGKNSYQQFQNSFSGANFVNFAKDQFYAVGDNYLAQKWNIKIPPNLTKNLYAYADSYITTGKGTFADADFKNVASNLAMTTISSVLDKQLNLPSGTSYQMYGLYQLNQAYQASQAVVNSLQTTISLAPTVRTGVALTSDDLIKIANADAAQAALPGAKASAGAAKAKFNSQAVSFGISLALVVFAEDLAKADASIGLPPGSIASLISTGYAAYLAAAPGSGAALTMGLYFAAAMAIYTIFFGFSKIEMQMTCPQDTLATAQGSAVSPHPNAYINRGAWCKEADDLYNQWARIQVKNITYEMLIAKDQLKDEEMLPTIMGTFRQEDVDFFNGVDGTDNLINRQYGPFSFMRGVKGLYQSDFMGDYVHIGY